MGGYQEQGYSSEWRKRPHRWSAADSRYVREVSLDPQTQSGHQNAAATWVTQIKPAEKLPRLAQPKFQHLE